METTNIPVTEKEFEDFRNFELYGNEVSDDKCPECATLMFFTYRALKGDDYAREWLCPGCGLLETE